MADETRVTTLIVRSQTDGADQAKQQVADLGAQVDKTSASIDAASQKQDAWRQNLNSLAAGLATTGSTLDSISSRFGTLAQVSGDAGLAFDSIGWDPAASGAAQLSGRLTEVSDALGLVSSGVGYASQALGTHTDATDELVESTKNLVAAQTDNSDATALSTAAWIAAGAAAVTLVGVTAGVVVGVVALKDALVDVADATGHWIAEMATGGLLDDMQQLVETGQRLNDLQTTTGLAASSVSILATGLQGTGLSAQTTQGIFDHLSQTLTGTGADAVAARTALRDMGVDVDALSKGGNGLQDVFLAAAGALSQFQDSTQKTALEQQLFGTSSADVINGVDGATAAFARQDSQTRQNITNLAAYVAQTEQLIAKYKDLRDNEPATLSQSQFSGGLAEIGGGYSQFAAGFNGGSGLFSSGGRNIMSAGLNDIGTGIEASWDTLDAKFQAGMVGFFNTLDDMFGSELTAELKQAAQTRMSQLEDAIQSELPTQAVDSRPSLPNTQWQEGSLDWANSDSTKFQAQYDNGTSALQRFSVAYSEVTDAFKRGMITEEEQTSDIQKLSDAYNDAINPFGKYLAQQQELLKIKQQFPPGDQRDLELTVARDRSQSGSSYDEGADRSLIQGNQAVAANDQAIAEAQAQAEAAQKTIDQLNLQTAAQDRLTAAVGQGWEAQQQANSENTIATALAENDQTNVDALTAALDRKTAADQRSIDANSNDQLQQELNIAVLTTQAHMEGAAAVANLAVALGNYEDVLKGVSEAQQEVNDNTRQQIELQKEESSAADYSQSLTQQIDLEQRQLDLINQTRGARTTDLEALKAQYEVAQKFPNISQDERDALVQQSQVLAQITGQVQDATKAYQDQQRQVKDVSNQIEREMSTDIYDVLSGKQTNLWQSFEQLGLKAISDVAAKLLETEFVMPVVADVIGSVGSAGGSSGSGSGLGSLTSLASSATNSNGLLGSLFGSSGTFGSSGDIANFLGVSSSGGIMGSLFGTSTGVGDISFAGTSGTSLELPTFGIEGEDGLFGGGEAAFDGVGSSTISGSTDGLLSSGGLGEGALGAAGGGLGALGGGYLAGNLIGGAVGSPGGGALAGAAGGAATGAIIGSIVPGLGTAIGAVLGGVAGAISGALSGQHPTVGPDSDAYTTYANGSLSIGGSGADNGGSLAASTDLATASITALNSATAALGVGIGSLGNIEEGTFKGQYYVKGVGEGGGPGVGTSTSSTDEATIVSDYVMEALKSATLTGLNDNGQTALKNSTATDLTDLTSDIEFGQQFDAAISAMKTGVTDYTQAAEVAAETTANQLTTSIENFKDKAAELGLSTQDAADATKALVENYLGLTTSQAPSALEQSVETLYGKLQGVAGLLSEVGIDQATATASVKEQVEQLLGITSAAPALGTFATEMASVKQTFADLAPILSALGISADEAATGLANAEEAVTQAANANIQSQLDQLTGGIGTSLQALVTSFTSTFADLQAVGGNMANAQELMAEDIANLYKPETTAAIQAVTTAFDNQITVEQNLSSTASKTATDLQTFLTSMGAGNLSDGSSLDQLNAAKAAFDQAVTASQSSDPTIAANAQGQLTTLAQQYLTDSKAYNASGQGYTDDYDYVQQQLTVAEQAADQQAAAATQQITLLQDQLDAATGTQNNTLTIAQALQQLNTLMEQENAAIAQSIAEAGGGKYTGSVTPNSGSSTGVAYSSGSSVGTNFTTPDQLSSLEGTIGNDYTTLLGRQGSSSEISYYVQMAQNGVSLAQIQQDFLNSPEYLASHSHASGGLAFGLSLVGENGPELADFSSPARIYTADQTRSILSGGNDNGTAAAIQSLQQEIASLKMVVAQGAVQTVDALNTANSYHARTARSADRAASRGAA